MNDQSEKCPCCGSVAGSNIWVHTNPECLRYFEEVKISFPTSFVSRVGPTGEKKKSIWEETAI